MGTSNKLHAKLSKGGLSDLPTGKMKGRADMPSVEKFIKDGLDPVHAAFDHRREPRTDAELSPRQRYEPIKKGTINGREK